LSEHRLVFVLSFTFPKFIFPLVYATKSPLQRSISISQRHEINRKHIHVIINKDHRNVQS